VTVQELARSCLSEQQKSARADSAQNSKEGRALQPVSLELLMLTAMILICSVANTPNIADCSRANALDVLWLPELFSNPVTCFMHGQAYVAGSAVGRDLTENERVKVVCLRKQVAVGGEAAVVKSNGPALP
jgi:hypothetical protein